MRKHRNRSIYLVEWRDATQGMWNIKYGEVLKAKLYFPCKFDANRCLQLGNGCSGWSASISKPRKIMYNDGTLKNKMETNMICGWRMRIIKRGENRKSKVRVSGQ